MPEILYSRKTGLPVLHSWHCGTGEHLPFFRPWLPRRQESARQAVDDGGAQTFWETNLARLPLSIPSQEGGKLFYKG